MIHRSQSNSNSYKWNGLASSLGFFTFVLTFLSGCGTSDDAPALSLVSGTVMVEGEPVTEGQVTLIPNTQMGTR